MPRLRRPAVSVDCGSISFRTLAVSTPSSHRRRRFDHRHLWSAIIASMAAVIATAPGAREVFDLKPTRSVPGSGGVLAGFFFPRPAGGDATAPREKSGSFVQICSRSDV